MHRPSPSSVAPRISPAGNHSQRGPARQSACQKSLAAAKIRIKQAELRAEQAKTRAEMAETRTDQAETRTELAKTRAEQAETRAEQAQTRTEQMETVLRRTLHKEPAVHTMDTIELPATSSLKYITAGPGPLEGLTLRQREILQLIAEGQNTKHIGDVLKLSHKTVEYHRVKLMQRLQIHDIPGLVRVAMRAGLIPPEK